jgi:septum formation protein
MLTCDGVAYDKASSLHEARERLRALRGKEHQLLSAVVIAKEGAVVWRHMEIPRLTMRPFTDAFLDDYLARYGEAALSSVGCYQLESGGAQLFARIQGDYFSILGLPLLAVMDYLRLQKALPA